MFRPRALSALFSCLILSTAILGQSTTQAVPAKTAPASVTQAAPAVQATAPTAAALSNPKTPAEFFARARQLSDLEAAGIPFHLKATFVASGDKDYTGNGSYEEWWQNANNWRFDATLGQFRAVSINTPDGPRLYASSGNIPEPVLDAMRSALIRIALDTGTTGRWRIKPKTIHGVKLIRVSVNSYRESNGSFIAGYTDFFTPGGVLRIHQSFNETTTYNDFHPFNGLLVPKAIGIRSEKNGLLNILIDTLEPMHSSAKATVRLSGTPAQLPLLANAVLGGTGATAAHIIYRVEPRYPDIAKADRIQGTVVFAAVIDENGKIRDLHAVKSANNILTQAARDAVQQWRYQPTIVGGKAVPVYTMISVVFTMAN